MIGGNGASQFFNLLTSTILFKFAQSSDVSKIFVLLGIFHIVNHFSDLGVNTSFLKFFGRYQRNEVSDTSSLVNKYIQIKTLITLCIFVFGFITVFSLNKLSLLEGYNFNDLIMLIIILCFEQMNSTQLNILRSQEKFSLMAINSFIGPLLKLIFVSLCLYSNSNSLLILAFFSTSFSSFIFGLIHVRTKIGFKLKECISFLKEIFNSTKWIYLSLLASAMISQIDVFMVKYLLDDNSVARLVSGQKYASIIPFVSMTLSSVLLPHVLNKNDGEVKIFIKNFLKTIPFFLVLIPLFIAGAYPVFKYFLSSTYDGALYIYSIYIFAYVFGMFSTSLSTVLYHSDNERILALMTVGQVLLNLISNYFFITWYGAAGAALTTAILKISSLIIIGFYVWKKILRKETLNV